MKFNKKYLLLTLVAFFGVSSVSAADVDTTPLKVADLKVLSSGEFLMAAKGVKQVRLYDSEGKNVVKSWDFESTPTGIEVTDTHYYVTTFDNSKGELYKIDAKSGAVEGPMVLESGSAYPVLTEDKKTLYVANQFQNTISKIDLTNFTNLGSVPVLREPKGSVITKDGNYLYVTNFLPQQRADIDTVCSAVTIIDLKAFKAVKNIPLENGSNALRGISLSPDGKYVLVSHNLGRFQVPTNQLQQGWMNTSAVSIIDVATQSFMGAVLLDEPEKGAAGIDRIAVNDSQIVVVHSGTHEVSIIDYEPFINKFIAHPNKRALNYDLPFLVGLRKRVPLVGNGPRTVVVEGNKAYVVTYFSDDLNVIDLEDKEVVANSQLQPNRVESDVFKGEMYFNDAAYCFQSWQSCNGCHPGDGRTDGMNWDLMNDGTGNAKNCKSMLFSHVTPPSMISGIRAMAEIAVRKGFTHIQFSEIDEERANCVDEYMKELKPVVSPYRINGELSESAKKGEKVFTKLGCINCHSGVYYTDMQMYRIGEDIEFEKGWDTPTLREVWRTAPYLFDGRAATMREVFEVHKHGIDKKVSKTDIDNLVEYVNSL